MGLVKKELSVLHDFIPSDAVELVIAYMHQYKIHLKIIVRHKNTVPASNKHNETIFFPAQIN